MALDDARLVAPLPAERPHRRESDPDRGQAQHGREHVARDLERVEPGARSRLRALDHPHQRERKHLEQDAEVRHALALDSPGAGRLAPEDEEDEEPHPAGRDEEPRHEWEQGDVVELDQHQRLRGDLERTRR
jgi:hypothetical protein